MRDRSLVIVSLLTAGLFLGVAALCSLDGCAADGGSHAMDFATASPADMAGQIPDLRDPPPADLGGGIPDLRVGPLPDLAGVIPDLR